MSAAPLRERQHWMLPCKALAPAELAAARAAGAAGWTKRAIGELADRMADVSESRDLTPVCLLSAGLGVVAFGGRDVTLGSLLVLVERAPVGWEAARAAWAERLTFAARCVAQESGRESAQESGRESGPATEAAA